MKQKYIFEEYETKILKKYKKGTKIEESDIDVLDRFTLIGLVKRGFDFDKMYPTAKLSDLGKELVE
jgi:hypothetical protein